MTEIPFSSKLAAWLITLGQIANGVGAFFLSADQVPFDLDAHDVGLTLVWIGTIFSIIVVALRRNSIPGITSGVELEKPLKPPAEWTAIGRRSSSHG